MFCKEKYKDKSQSLSTPIIFLSCSFPHLPYMSDQVLNYLVLILAFMALFFLFLLSGVPFTLFHLVNPYLYQSGPIQENRNHTLDISTERSY